MVVTDEHSRNKYGTLISDVIRTKTYINIKNKFNNGTVTGEIENDLLQILRTNNGLPSEPVREREDISL